jgi:sulfate adenylyltransferase subunit 2
VCMTSPAGLVSSPSLNHLEWLESEAISIIRQVVGESEHPLLLFSGGKDSIVLSHLIRKAFWPAPMPVGWLHVDTGHNFPETIAYRDEWAAALGARLHVRFVEDSIRAGRVVEETGPGASRNTLQTVTLLDALRELNCDVAFGGARRDEEKARAKERIVSVRDPQGRWEPRLQRPELWNLLNVRHARGEHLRVFPLSNWTELDIWLYLEREQLPLPSLYFSHERDCVGRNGQWLAAADSVGSRPDDQLARLRVRFRTVGDMTCTGAVVSEASSIRAIIEDLITSRQSERGTRADDQRSAAAMEDRKREGYF